VESVGCGRELVLSVDGTLIEASMKSFHPRDGADEPPGGGRNSSRNFYGEQRRNDTIPPPPMPRRGCSARARARRPGCA
jgi:hypothetical protein